MKPRSDHRTATRPRGRGRVSRKTLNSLSDRSRTDRTDKKDISRESVERASKRVFWCFRASQAVGFIRGGSQLRLLDRPTEWLLSGVFFEFCCCLFFKEKRYLKFCIQRQSLAFFALREKLFMPNSSHFVLCHLKKMTHLHVAGTSYELLPNKSGSLTLPCLLTTLVPQN